MATSSRKQAEQLVDLRAFFQQGLLTLDQAAGDQHSADAPLEPDHFPDRIERLLPGTLQEATRVDDHEIGPVRLGNHFITVQTQQAEHPLAIDQVLRTAEADNRVGAFAIVLRGASQIQNPSVEGEVNATGRAEPDPISVS